ncbi:torso-like protein [Anabrus simplex]|uniref:torso-like protein n=1 Tax=Anabrus simplex TaxID=316456 RepID=UPI0035A3AB09
MSSRAELLIALLSLLLLPATGQLLHLGAAINIFSRYGYLSISMRVVPRNDTDTTWIFREPTVDIFKNSSLHPAPLSMKELNQPKPIFTGDFHMEFCDNLKQLLQAYFRDFSVEKLDRPWRAFTGSWGRGTIARHLGINSTYLISPNCYVLIRVARHREKARLSLQDEEPELDDAVAREADSVRVGDTASVVNFIRSFGSHYIASYVTGNSLYQVFVYSQEVYRSLKQKMKERGVAALSNSELSSYFSPWYAEHIGRIKSASGNATVEAWAVQYLRVHYYFFTYPSLLKLHGDASLLKTLNELLGNEALLQLDLRTLVPAFKDPDKRLWFQDVVDNYLKLWEVNM